MIRRRFSFSLLFLFCLACVSLTNAQEATDVQPLKIMSFNLRLGVANDGDNHWDKRKDLLVSTIKNYAPDVMGTQETFDFQAKFIGEKLPEFTYVGRSRQKDGKGEHCGIFFRSDRFDKLIEGHFWLSETPDAPGSKSWDSSLPRMATWLKLWDRATQKSFYVINTHFDHRGKLAREESAKQIRRFVLSLPQGSSAVLTGDFNAGVDSKPYAAMFAEHEAPSPFVDSFLDKHPQASTEDGTFNGFQGQRNSARIDWIAVSNGFDIVSAEINRSSDGERFPSDHFPVTASLRQK